MQRLFARGILGLKYISVVIMLLKACESEGYSHSNWVRVSSGSSQDSVLEDVLQLQTLARLCWPAPRLVPGLSQAIWSFYSFHELYPPA